MGRTVKGRGKRYEPRPVQRIELSEENKKKRAIAAVLFLIIGVVLLVYCLMVFITPEKGWAIIKADKTENNSGDFVFQYYLGADGNDTRAENRAITELYNRSSEKIYRLLNENSDFDGMVNIHTLNENPNTEFEVDEALYKVFSLFADYKSRYLYIAPIYTRYENLFYCTDDYMISDFDPVTNNVVRLEYETTAAYAKDSSMIDLKLLGGNKVKLFVAEEYLSYAEKEGITSFIGMSWLKNAFEVDYIADTMIESGFIHGSISSVDGFVRNFDSGNEIYGFNVYDNADQNIYLAAIMNYVGERSIVCLRNFAVSDMEIQRYYTLKNGETRAVYLDLNDGFPKSSADMLLSYSTDKSCAEVLLEIVDIYVADSFDEGRLSSLKDKGVFSVYCKGNSVMYNDKDLNFSQLYKDEGKEYRVKLFD